MSIPIEETQLECEGLVTHLQNAAELKDTVLSHELHDELGGLMGAAVMDLDAVRRVTEELRPSILDDFGLFAALRWQLKKTWGDSAIISSEAFPDVEPAFESGAPIVLFRIAHEALSIALMRVAVKSTDLTVRADPANFWMKFSDDGAPDTEKQPDNRAILLASMRHRIRVFGGKVEISNNEAGATALTVWMPLHRAGATR